MVDAGIEVNVTVGGSDTGINVMVDAGIEASVTVGGSDMGIDVVVDAAIEAIVTDTGVGGIDGIDVMVDVDGGAGPI